MAIQYSVHKLWVKVLKKFPLNECSKKEWLFFLKSGVPARRGHFHEYSRKFKRNHQKSDIFIKRLLYADSVKKVSGDPTRG